MSYKDTGSSLNRQHVFWIAAGGVALGVGGFALYYQRKKNLSAGRPRPPRSQIQMQSESPPSPKPGNGSSPPPAGNGNRDTSTASGSPPPPDQPLGQSRNGAEQSSSGKGENGSRGSNGQHSQSHAESVSPETGTDSPFPYGWAQNNEEAFLVTSCPLDLVSKEVRCTIHPRSMQLSVRGDMVVDGPLYGPVDTSESIWELEDLDGKKKLTVTLVKAAHCSGQADWPTLLTNAPMPALNTVVV